MNYLKSKRVFSKVYGWGNVFVTFISFYFLKIDQIQSIVPYYYLPTINNLNRESLSIGKNAYQLLYFGEYKQSLNLAKLAIQINKNDEKLWLILSEAQLANKLYKNALFSINKALTINPENSETYFAKSNIYLKISELKNVSVYLIKV